MSYYNNYYYYYSSNECTLVYYNNSCNIYDIFLRLFIDEKSNFVELLKNGSHHNLDGTFITFSVNIIIIVCKYDY